MNSHIPHQMVPHAPDIPAIIWKWSIQYNMFSAVFNLLRSSKNQEMFKKHLCNQSSHYENLRMISIMLRKPSWKLIHFAVKNKKEDTGIWFYCLIFITESKVLPNLVLLSCCLLKLPTGKSMKNARYVFCGMQKYTSQTKATSNSKKAGSLSHY